MSTGVVGLARSMNDMSGRLHGNGVSWGGFGVVSVLSWASLDWAIWSGHVDVVDSVESPAGICSLCVGLSCAV